MSLFTKTTTTTMTTTTNLFLVFICHGLFAEALPTISTFKSQLITNSNESVPIYSSSSISDSVATTIQKIHIPLNELKHHETAVFAIGEEDFLIPTDPSELFPIPPRDIATGEELEALGKYVAPVLYGGLGNVLFQLAALQVYAHNVNVPCVVGFFNHWNRKFHTFAPWGGHDAPGVGAITLKTVFPNLQWLATDSYRIDAKSVANKYAFAIKRPDEFVEMPSRDELPKQIHGYFFNHLYWHDDRELVLQKLKFNPAIDAYLFDKYWYELGNASDVTGSSSPVESVSVHARFGYQGEPAKGLLHERKFPPKEFLENSFMSLGLKNKIYLIFSDDEKRAEREFAPFERAGFDLRFIDENSVMSLRLMSLCKHHIMTSSTLSFWGAYLDPNQPSGGRTLLHNSFYDAHGEKMIPYASWEVSTI